MPVKRRTSKAHRLTAECIYELQFGPGQCLLAGLGYYRFGEAYWQLSPEQQAEVHGEMRGDWERYHPTVLAAWNAIPIDDRPEEPWAQIEFGEPR
jgi:hypothetical protein